MSQRYCLTLDLKNDPQLIAEYEAYHQEVWPEIVQSIKDSGITNMEIYRFQNRLFMIMETGDDFSNDRLRDGSHCKSHRSRTIRCACSTTSRSPRTLAITRPRQL